MNVSDPAWQCFAALHNEVDPDSIDRSFARDEALDGILNEVVADSAPREDLVRKRFHSLRRNRLSKQRHRRALQTKRYRSSHRRGGSDFGSVLLIPPTRDDFDQLSFRQLIELIRSILSRDEFTILFAIADGHSYSEIARDRNMTVSSLKSKAFRARDKVRSSRIASALQDEMRR